MLSKIGIVSLFVILYHCNGFEDSSYTIESDWISSPRITNWGSWGVEETCLRNHFVNSVRIKLEDDQGKADDSGLNGVQLFCTEETHEYTDDPGDLLIPNGAWVYPKQFFISSSVGDWGTWRTWESCPNQNIAIGFQLKSEKNQGDGDDCAANDVKLICTGKTETKAQGGAWGDWTERQICKDGTAVCGIRTQVEEKQGFFSDDSSLNNVDIKCCSVRPGKTCIPSERWTSIIKIDKAYYNYYETINYSVGVSRVASEISAFERISLSEYLPFTLEFLKDLSENFKNSIGKSRIDAEWNWETISQDLNTWTAALNNWKDLEIETEEGCGYDVKQLVGICGPYNVQTSRLRIDKLFC